MIDILLKTADWSDGQFLLLAYVSVCIGFLFAKAVFPKRRPIGRIVFLFFFASSRVTFAAASIGWLHLDFGHRYGILEGMILALYLLAVLEGMVLQQLCSGRAADIWGDSRRDWTALIPFGIVVFLLRGGQKAEAAQSIPNTPARACLFVARDFVLILTGLAFLATSKVIEERIEHAASTPTPSTTRMWAELLDDRSPRVQFEAEVAGTRPLLPVEIDSVTTLIAIRSDADRLVMTHRFYDDPETLDEHFKTALAYWACDPEMFASALSQGGTVQYDYTGSANRPLKSFTIRQPDCANL